MCEGKIWSFFSSWYSFYLWPLQWRHNGCDGISNHQPHDCLLSRLFMCRSLAFVRGIHRKPVNSPQKRPVTQKMFPFDDIMIRICIIKIRWSRGNTFVLAWYLKSNQQSTKLPRARHMLLPHSDSVGQVLYILNPINNQQNSPGLDICYCLTVTAWGKYYIS